MFQWIHNDNENSEVLQKCSKPHGYPVFAKLAFNYCAQKAKLRNLKFLDKTYL